jgi:hypothetical protein
MAERLKLMRHAIDLKKAKAEKVTGGDNIAVILIMELSINALSSAFLVKLVVKPGMKTLTADQAV